MRFSLNHYPKYLDTHIYKKLPLTSCYEIMNGDAKPLKRNHGNVILTQKQQRCKRWVRYIPYNHYPKHKFIYSMGLDGLGWDRERREAEIVDKPPVDFFKRNMTTHFLVTKNIVFYQMMLLRDKFSLV